MSKERMVQVTKDECENLIRDQYTVELLTGYAQKQGWMADSMLCLLLGIQEPKHELPPGWDPESESETAPLRGAREEIGQKENRPWKSTGAASGRLVEQKDRG